MRKKQGFDVFLILFYAVQIALVFLYIIFMDFTRRPAVVSAEIVGAPERHNNLFNFWVHIAFLVFLGFGLLLGFLRKYNYTSIGLTFLVSAFAFLWALLFNGFFDWAHEEGSKIDLESDNIILALYATASTVIAYGALAGRLNALQTVFVAFWAVFLYCLNYWLVVVEVGARDFGGALTIHWFAALFGFAASLISGINDTEKYTASGAPGQNNQRPSYFGETLTLVGAAVVWVFFPSFNAALAPNGSQYRVIVNTVAALTASTTAVFCLMWIHQFFWFVRWCISKRQYTKKKCTSVWNATELATASFSGAIALGSAHSVLIDAWEAMFVGLVAGIATWLALHFFGRWINNPDKVPFNKGESLWGKLPRDTRGILFTHGVPGLIGTIAGMIAGRAYEDGRWGQSFTELFADEDDQADRIGYGLIITTVLSIFGGAGVGFVSLFMSKTVPSEHFPGRRRNKYPSYHDETTWSEVPLEIDW